MADAAENHGSQAANQGENVYELKSPGGVSIDNATAFGSGHFRTQGAAIAKQQDCGSHADNQGGDEQ